MYAPPAISIWNGVVTDRSPSTFATSSRYCMICLPLFIVVSSFFCAGDRDWSYTQATIEEAGWRDAVLPDLLIRRGVHLSLDDGTLIDISVVQKRQHFFFHTYRIIPHVAASPGTAHKIPRIVVLVVEREAHLLSEWL